jgi:Amt family ammonium transporter
VLVALVAILWAGAATFVVASIVKLVIGLRLPEEDEIEGIDFVEHGESAYDLSPAGGSRRAGSPLAPSTGVLDAPAAAKEEANA